MVRKAQPKDIDAIFELIELHASNQQMLHRSFDEIDRDISDFIVYDFEGLVVGACSLKYGWERLVEIRSLVVHPDFYRRGFASSIVGECVESAISSSKVEGVFVLTYAVQLFEKFGFQRIHKSALPLKVWEDCMDCSKKK